MHIGNSFSHFSSFQSGSSHDNGRHLGQGFGQGHGEHAFGFGGPPGFRPQGDQGQTQQGGPTRQTQQMPQLQDPQHAGPVTGNSPFGSNYTVQRGDTLWQISDRMRAAGDQRGNWDIINEIARDNGIKNPDMIFPGQTFNLRGPMSADSFTPSKDPSSPIQGNAMGPGAQGDGVPWIGQMNPAGADKNYTNASQNCGPAVMAMIAREHGLGKGMDDADLISSLGKVGQTNANGTTGNGLIAMADQMNLKSTAEPGANSSWVMSQLQQGKDVVSNGDYWALPQHADANQTSPHYILLTGIDQNGNITVEDPMDPNVRSLTAAQLDAYNNASAQGGFNVAFG
ncbi:MAG TPA: papain-like cysteine protease family protein [Myxococcaceae bacterium]|nr:papain-like cysteine protease family protein [Myxococcaceae bacterium]